MQKIRNKNFAASPAVAIDGKIELLHVDDFPKTGSHFSTYMQEEESLRQSFDENTSFFYTIENFDSEDVNSRQKTHAERGLANVSQEGDKFFLNRIVCIETAQKEDDLPYEDGFLVFDENTYLVVGSYIPRNYIDLFYENNAVICSTDAQTPSPIQINENSLLGRLENEIQSIDGQELALILTTNFTVESLQANSSPLLLSAKHVEVLDNNSKLSSAHMVARPRKTRPKNREAGSIIFNEKKKCLEFFNGIKWVRINTED